MTLWGAFLASTGGAGFVVETGHGPTRLIFPTIGVWQGAVESPLWFAMALDPLLRRIARLLGVIDPQGLFLLYADDAVVICSAAVKLAQVAALLSPAYKVIGLKVHIGKTVYFNTMAVPARVATTSGRGAASTSMGYGPL